LTATQSFIDTGDEQPAYGSLGALLLAIAASLVFHLTLIFGTQVEVPDFDPMRLPVLEARLQPMQKSEPISQPPAPPAAEPPRKVVKPKPRKAPIKLPPAPLPQPVPEAVEPPIPEVIQPPPPPVAEISPELNRNYQRSEVPAPPPPPVRSSQSAPLPRNVLIHFTVNWGVDGLNAGKTDFIWQSKDGHYSLSSVAQYTGLVGLFKADRILQTSLGDIKDGVLQPNFFTLQRGQSRAKTETATFDWPASAVTFSDGEKSKTAPLEKGAQDILSL
jgi:hypothetical protein